MKFDPPLISAKLIRRYKRFLFDAQLPDGTIITGSCPNTGSMRGLTEPGSTIWLSLHNSPTRKYKHAFELVEVDGILVGINTGLPNRLTEEAISKNIIADLHHYPSLKREQKYGINSRIDLLLECPKRGKAYIEVKNVHFSRTKNLAEFPDSVTARGTKHLEELGRMVEEGHRAVMIYMIQREDCDAFKICAELDPAYGEAYVKAHKLGVEAYAIKCSITNHEILPKKTIAII